MNQKYFILFFCLTAVLPFLSCREEGRVVRQRQDGDTVPVHHADYLTMVEYDDYTLVTIRNPWDTARSLVRYALTEKSVPLPKGMDAVQVVVPIKKAVFYSAVHCSLLEQLQALDAVAGVCDLSYISSPTIHRRCSTGQTLDLGSSMSPDVEKIMDLQPDGVLLSSFESGGYGKVEAMRFPIIECADYMETSPLGRAEWMRFYGRLFGVGERADSLFQEVSNRYVALKRVIEQVTKRPRVFADVPLSGVWYVPSGRSYMVQMFEDAGAKYVFSDLQKSGSVPLGVEHVFDRAHDADIWLIKYWAEKDRTYKSLAEEHPLYVKFKAYRERRVYSCNTAKVAYYEEVPFSPDRILKDLMCIFHPDSVNGHTLLYYRTMKEQ